MELKFGKYRYQYATSRIAKHSQRECIYTDLHSPSEAFMLLIKGLKRESLCNLCEKMNSYFPEEDCYSLTQGNGDSFKNNSRAIQDAIYKCALDCLKEEKYMGNEMGEVYNTTAWINHSLYVAQVAGQFAKKMGLDENVATTLGLVHDIGRKETHSMEHITKGFEILINNGWIREAVIAITHSYIEGEKIEDDNDDISKALEGYKYNEYDKIICLADLMALKDKIVEPSERIREKFLKGSTDDKLKRKFLVKVTQVLYDFLHDNGYIVNYKILKSENMIEIQKSFEGASEIFYDYYLSNIVSSIGER